MTFCTTGGRGWLNRWCRCNLWQFKLSQEVNNFEIMHAPHTEFRQGLLKDGLHMPFCPSRILM